jgi:hypothetical protein
VITITVSINRIQKHSPEQNKVKSVRKRPVMPMPLSSNQERKFENSPWSQPSATQKSTLPLKRSPWEDRRAIRGPVAIRPRRLVYPFKVIPFVLDSPFMLCYCPLQLIYDSFLVLMLFCIQFSMIRDTAFWLNFNFYCLKRDSGMRYFSPFSPFE